MQDDFDSATARARRGPGTRSLALIAVTALALGGIGGIVAANRLGWTGFAARSESAPPSPLALSPAPAPAASPAENAQAALGVRIAELEQRMTRLNLAAEAASGNAARAENLLIAAAARRAIDRGTPLGYLADQLKLRFADSQPNAVATLIASSGDPVTLDALRQELAALRPALRELPRDAGSWDRLRQELADLIVIRRTGTPSPMPSRRLERAEAYVAGGHIEAALGEVERMPGRAAAELWIARAHRYLHAQRALDLIETSAILGRGEADAGASGAAPQPTGY